MKVVVCGSRHITNYQFVEQCLESLVANQLKITELVSGAAKGVDSLAETWALKKGIPIKRYHAEWEKYGVSAGPRRNRQMGDYCDCVVAIWDGKSRGTENMIDYTKSLGKKVYLFVYEGTNTKFAQFTEQKHDATNHE